MATQEEIDAFLAHHGVLGMHWGVRKASSRSEEDGGSEKSSAPKNARQKELSTSDKKTLAEAANAVKNLNEHDKAVLKAAGVSAADSPAYEAKYGPDSMKAPKKGLTPLQKNLIIGGLVVGGIAGLAIIGAHANSDDALVKGMVKNGIGKSAAEYLIQSDKTKNTHSKGLEDIAKLGAEDLSFNPGHIFSRVSTEAEKTIRPEGFFAAHNPEDVERYKAVLPIYWKMWPATAGKTSGFVNHYSSDSPLKIASEKTIYDTMKKALQEEAPGVSTLRDLINVKYGVTHADDEALLKKMYYPLVANFIDTDDQITKRLSGILKEAGYHGIVDANDSGSLSASPVKFLDGSLFKIVGHESLSEKAIKAAQVSITALAHLMAFIFDKDERKGGADFMDEDVDEFLAHFGVKGMQWGVRHARADAHESVKAKLAIGEGASSSKPKSRLDRPKALSTRRPLTNM